MPQGVPEILPSQNREGSDDDYALKKEGCRFPAGFLCALKKYRISIVAWSLTTFQPSMAVAQSSGSALSVTPFGSGEVILLALFGGAMSFAMMAAFWLIRERNKANDENRELKISIQNYKATTERNEALINVTDQRVVLWNGAEEKPVVLGSLPSASGAPNSREEFIRFGSWVKPDCSKTFEEALFGLRKKAEAFDMALQTTGGGIIEAQGRTSGAFAFVRFIELSGERAALAHLEAEHTRLMATFDSIQSLFDQLDMQVWLSKNDGSLYWANTAYANAVEVVDAVAAVDNDIRLFDRTERNEIDNGLQKNGNFHGPLPAIISGDRKIVEVVAVTSDTGGAGIAVDKSDVEIVRNTLKQTIANHANTLDQLSTPVAIFDADKNLKFYNSGFQKLWKLDTAFLDLNPSNAAILNAMRDKKRLPPQPDWHKWREDQLAVYQALETQEDWWHLPDGITLHVVISPQNLGGATWIFEDVTETLELQSRYKSLVRVQGETLDHLNEAVAVFGMDGRLRLSNPALWTMLQIKPPEEGQKLHITELTKRLKGKFKSPDIWDDIVGSITAYDDERDGNLGRLYLKDGNIVEFALVPLPDGQTMLTLVNVTANVNIELALTERNDALEEAGNLKNRFLQHVSYELRTPLTTISGFGELLSMEQTGNLNSVQREYLGHINSSSSVLKAIIDDILDLATIDAGAMELDLKEFDIADIVSGVIDSLKTVLSKNHVTVKTGFDNKAKMVIADATRFRQIIYNLISNAIQHSPDGGTILVASKLSGHDVLVSVSDQGPGVPQQEREMIFSRFESGTNGVIKGGAGLGLSIVKSFMKLHDGDVYIEDADNHGAKFICAFPADPSDLRQAAQ